MLMSCRAKGGCSLSQGITLHRWRSLEPWDPSTDASAYPGMVGVLSPSPCPEKLLYGYYKS